MIQGNRSWVNRFRVQRFEVQCKSQPLIRQTCILVATLGWKRKFMAQQVDSYAKRRNNSIERPTETHLLSSWKPRPLGVVRDNWLCLKKGPSWKWSKVESDLKLRNSAVYKRALERSDSITLVILGHFSHFQLAGIKTRPLSGANQCPVLWAGILYLKYSKI